ncbi:peptidylprolyl isomerase [Halalkalibacillus sediminis]|uniref:Peptidyl-prolyl cis-trans isomerase n=1 Tax=Halalkalibacillus sediminis TaxID=2018042 RepID=A0A2I0QX70_9BACI|nr:peptidylprolyl isomerase [Halalkalibacillus sediminis]PKR78898.1 peptidylprolyl isomerase [Halalkalibacillus sediminis]
MKQATIHFENGEQIKIDLYDQEAPNTVDNFVKLAEDGFYDGLTFHRVIPNFVIQGGCPKGDGTGGPGYTIKCETEGNPHKHQRGTLSMAHAGKDTGGSQFFVCHSPQPHLDGRHTVFGQVTDGVEIVDRVKPGDVMEKVVVEK